MRAHALLLLLFASGCSLYFNQSSPGDDGPPPDAGVTHDGGTRWPDARVLDGGGAPYPDAPWLDAGPVDIDTARCEDGQIYAVPARAGDAETPGHGAGRVIGRCPGACRSAAVACTTPDCENAATALCDAPASLGATCALEGAACDGSSTLQCPESTSCNSTVLGSTCACVNSRYRCKQVTPAAATQAAIVGKWRGLVTPRLSAPPYAITLWIYPDGTYWADAADPAIAFYYGGDGPSPDRHITIQSTSDTLGSDADITIDFGYSPPNHGALSALVVNPTTLRFTYYTSWLGCTQPFDVNLTRY